MSKNEKLAMLAAIGFGLVFAIAYFWSAFEFQVQFFEDGSASISACLFGWAGCSQLVKCKVVYSSSVNYLTYKLWFWQYNSYNNN